MMRLNANAATSTDQRLTQQIHAVMLGGAPAHGVSDSKRTRHRRARSFESLLKPRQHSPFHETTLFDRVERCAVQAARAIDEARERIALARPRPLATFGEKTASADAIVTITLVGPVARFHSRAA